jgi:hypothetical protein
VNRRITKGTGGSGEEIALEPEGRERENGSLIPPVPLVPPCGLQPAAAAPRPRFTDLPVLGSFPSSISPWFDLSHNVKTSNVIENWLRSGAFFVATPLIAYILLTNSLSNGV